MAVPWRWLLATSLLLRPFVLGTGKGPVGLYAVDERYVVVADSNFDALIVVDTRLGGVAGRLLWPVDSDGARLGVANATAEKKRWVSLTGVASCDRCPFAYVTSNHGAEFWRVDFARPLAEMARRGDFGDVATATVAAAAPDGLDAATWLRMVAISGDGTRGFVADLKRGLFEFDPRAHPSNLSLAVPSRNGTLKLAGLRFGDDEKTLVAVSFDEIVVVDLATMGTRALPLDACRAQHAREAVEVDGKYYVVSGPKTRHGRSESKAVYEVDGASGACSALTSTRGDLGWRDGPGDAVRVSRPHGIARLPGEGLRLALTDIDNRAVRLVTVAVRPPPGRTSATVSTVPYDDADLWHALYGGGQPRPAPAAPRFSSLPRDKSKTATAADAACGAEGGRSCRPADLRDAAWLRGLDEPFAAWTNGTCQSCWLHWPGTCGHSPKRDRIDQLARAKWGANVRMAAHVAPARGGAAPILRFECVLADRPLPKPRTLCCGAGDPPPPPKAPPGTAVARRWWARLVGR